jgi:hypothetical protein
MADENRIDLLPMKVEHLQGNLSAFPQSNKKRSPSRRTMALVRNLLGSGIMPLVPKANTSKFMVKV